MGAHADVSHTRAHTHTHTQRERERETDRQTDRQRERRVQGGRVISANAGQTTDAVPTVYTEANLSALHLSGSLSKVHSLHSGPQTASEFTLPTYGCEY
jgi:hypothetical protein